MAKKRVLSGMRPTGKLHLGHLVGALNNWVKLQKDYECLFMVADWHALMSEYEDPKQIRAYSIDNVADWISCGVDPSKSAIFLQSEVKEHLELFMVLSCITPLSWLQRCPTYKEQLKTPQVRDLSTYGFLGYPVLQASDILIYKSCYVPVGEDQLPHLELAREISRRFNRLYGKELFPEPQALVTKNPRLLGIDNRKMSKSYDNFIALSDPPELISQKVGGMFTDPKRIRLSDPGHPKTCNVYTYYEAFLPEILEEARHWCEDAKIGCTQCKQRLASSLIEYLSEIQNKKIQLMKNKHKIEALLDKGSGKVRKIAQDTIKQVKKIISLGIGGSFAR